MSWQAQTAVTNYSQQNKLAAFRLLMYLADKADENGVIDPAPNQATLAEFVGCTDRTIRNHLDTLTASKELEQVRVGSGPGRPSVYRITLPMPEKVEKKAEKTPSESSASIAELAAKVEKIEQILSTFNPEIFHLLVEKVEKISAKVEKVEKKGGKGLVELGADDPYYDPYYDPCEREEIAHATSAGTEFQDSLAEMEAAIATVCKLNLAFPKHKAKIEPTAVNLISLGYSPEQVKVGFSNGGWWYTHGHGAKNQTAPYLGNIETDIGRVAEWIQAGKPAKVVTNGMNGQHAAKTVIDATGERGGAV